MPFDVQCPGCSQRIKVSDRRCGQSVNCPNCNQVIQLKTSANNSATDSTEFATTEPIRAEKITIPCVCGAKLRTSTEAAGKQVECPKCASRITVQHAGSGVGIPIADAVLPTIANATPPSDSEPSISGSEEPDLMDPFDEVPYGSSASVKPVAPIPDHDREDLWKNLPTPRISTPIAPAQSHNDQVASYRIAPLPAPAIAIESSSDEQIEAGSGDHEQAASGHREDVGYALRRWHLAMVLMMFVGPFIAHTTYKSRLHQNWLVDEGVRVEGVVSDTWIGKGSRFQRIYWAEVEYSSPEGEEAWNDFQVRDDYFASLAEGRGVTVAYHPDDMDDAILIGGSNRSLFGVWIGIGMMILGILGVAQFVYVNFSRLR